MFDRRSQTLDSCFEDRVIENKRTADTPLRCSQFLEPNTPKNIQSNNFALNSLSNALR